MLHVCSLRLSKLSSAECKTKATTSKERMYIGLHSVIILLIFNRRCQSLNCFVCHSRQNPDCGDPFPKNGNSSGLIALYECDRVRKVGEGLIAASNAIGAVPPSYSPLETGSSHCYKISMGEYAVRGCAKADFCANMTGVCDLCNSNGCNKAHPTSEMSFPLMIFLKSLSLVFTTR